VQASDGEPGGVPEVVFVMQRKQTVMLGRCLDMHAVST
jgi:hypothetical protein